MRFLCFLFLVVFAGAVGVFAWQNQQEVTVGFFDWGVTASVAAVVGIAYVLGMLSGWSVVGMVRRSIHRVTDRPTAVERQYAQAR
jgi:hypothetical protein